MPMEGTNGVVWTWDSCQRKLFGIVVWHEMSIPRPSTFYPHSYTCNLLVWITIQKAKEPTIRVSYMNNFIIAAESLSRGIRVQKTEEAVQLTRCSKMIVTIVILRSVSKHWWSAPDSYAYKALVSSIYSTKLIFLQYSQRTGFLLKTSITAQANPVPSETL